jgi:diguanylate cyclase (GGDEF)-like protein
MDKSTLNILIIDDDEGDRKQIKRALKQSGLICECVETVSVESALLACEHHAFDCTIIDYELPGQDGLAGITALHTLLPYMAIIMSTGHGDEMVATEAIKHGASDYIVKKNLDPTLLRKTIVAAIEKKELEKQLSEQISKIEYMAYHDYLTDIPNRLLFEQAVVRALAHAKRYKKLVGLLFIDLDRFKNINDVLGHGTGDSLLQQVTKRFQSAVREEEMVARLGGDEFGVLIGEMSELKAAGFVANNLIDSLKAPFLLDTKTVYVTPSIGIATYPFAGKTVSELMKNADIAMYQAKMAGKNNFQFYTPKFNQ